ncbi:hypothetical protein T492DRAFT_832296 [Pavlovales sp. CCMP2436]|nr:hypothetical protein T492DRAFT_832296 [Pavlovales sp. CCMP2436]
MFNYRSDPRHGALRFALRRKVSRPDRRPYHGCARQRQAPRLTRAAQRISHRYCRVRRAHHAASFAVGGCGGGGQSPPGRGLVSSAPRPPSVIAWGGGQCGDAESPPAPALVAAYATFFELECFCVASEFGLKLLGFCEVFEVARSCFASAAASAASNSDKKQSGKKSAQGDGGVPLRGREAQDSGDELGGFQERAQLHPMGVEDGRRVAPAQDQQGGANSAVYGGGGAEGGAGLGFVCGRLRGGGLQASQ